MKDKDAQLRAAIKWVDDLAGAADGALDHDTYDQVREFGELDAPNDAEVCIRIGTREKINALFRAIAELRRTAAAPAYPGYYAAKEDDSENPHGLPWRAQPWGDGSSPTGMSNIVSDALHVVIATELPTETAAFIVTACNAYPAHQKMVEALGACIAMIEDSVAGHMLHNHDVVFVPGVSDLELKPDGSYLLSQARAALALAEPSGDRS